MSSFGIVFCGRCDSKMVDSGFASSISTLRCCECGNEEEFKIGKVRLDEEIIDVNDILKKAKKDANIIG